MNEQELNELKKKVAEWAGFKRDTKHSTFRKEGGTIYTDAIGWITPSVNGHRGLYEELPNFPQSFDACLQWLVPGLEPLGYELGITNDSEVLGWRVSLHNIKSECSIASPYCDCQLNGIALALCLAIEKLIDKGKHEG